MEKVTIVSPSNMEENKQVSDSINSVVENGNKTSKKPCNVSEEVFKELQSFPPGWRFAPSDEELIIHYLLNKVEGKKVPKNKIVEVNIYKYHPKVLIEEYNKYGDNEEHWYFFTPRDKKYRNGSRPNRAAIGGYWKATGADKKIYFEGKKIGLRKALVFYTGKAPNGEKTNWIMHEFRALSEGRVRVLKDNPNSGMRLDDCILCRIHGKVERPTGRGGNLSNKQSRPVDDFNEEVKGASETSLNNVLESVIDDGFGLSNEFNLHDPNHQLAITDMARICYYGHDFPLQYQRYSLNNSHSAYALNNSHSAYTLNNSHSALNHTNFSYAGLSNSQFGFTHANFNAGLNSTQSVFTNAGLNSTQSGFPYFNYASNRSSLDDNIGHISTDDVSQYTYDDKYDFDSR